MKRIVILLLIFGYFGCKQVVKEESENVEIVIKEKVIEKLTMRWIGAMILN